MNFIHKFQKTFNTKFLLLVLSASSLIFLLVAALIVGLMKEPFSILAYSNEIDPVVFISSEGKQMKRQITQGEFIAKENNLGILAVRFDTFNVKNSEPILFRIKEIKEKEWFYVNSYKAKGLQHNKLFTFGFPKISDSKDKKYEFEIIATKKRYGKTIGLSSETPVAVTKYQFSKSELFKDAGTLLNYLDKKVKNIIINLELTYGFLLEGLLYYLLLLCVLLFFFTKDKYFPSFEAVILIFLTFMILDASTIIDLQNGVRLLVVLVVWMFLIKHYLVDSSILFLLAIFLVIYASLMLFFGQKLFAERASFWIYIIMLIGIIQAIWQIHEKNHKNDYKVLIIHIISPFTKSRKLLWLLSTVKISMRDIKRNFLNITLKVIAFYKIPSRSFKRYVLWGMKIIITLFLLLLFMNTIVIPLLYGYKHESFVSVIHMKQETSASSFYIQNVEPSLVHHGDNIVIFGKGFNLISPAKFMSNYGELSSSYWSDKTVIFSVPLHWEVGEVLIWAEKKRGERNHIIETSNVVKVRVIDRLGDFNTDDVTYFRQIKYLDNTTKKANKFRNYKFGKWIIGDSLMLF